MVAAVFSNKAIRVRVDSPPSEPSIQPSPTLADLCLSFLLLGLMGFGGVLPIARQMIVVQKKWLDNEQFLDLLGLCQFLPGGNIINISVAVGMRFRGAPGAIAALLGLLAAPSAIAVSLASIYDRFSHFQVVGRLFEGLSAAAAGLLVALAVKLTSPLWRQPLPLAIAVVCFVVIALVRAPLLEVMLVLTPISVFLRRWARA